MSTDDNTHSTSGYWVLTGFKYRGTNAREIQATDWPNLGSVVKMLKPSESLPFSFAWLPEPMVANPGVLVSGQSAGFLGPHWDPDRFTCDPQSDNFVIREFQLPGDLPPLRLSSRSRLLDQFNRHCTQIERTAGVQDFGRLQQEALGVLTTGRARQAFAMDQEPDAVRDRYTVRWSLPVGGGLSGIDLAALDDLKLERMRDQLPVMPNGEVATMVESWID